jgi:hypothetical protein
MSAICDYNSQALTDHGREHRRRSLFGWRYQGPQAEQTDFIARMKSQPVNDVGSSVGAQFVTAFEGTEENTPNYRVAHSRPQARTG